MPSPRSRSCSGRRRSRSSRRRTCPTASSGSLTRITERRSPPQLAPPGSSRRRPLPGQLPDAHAGGHRCAGAPPRGSARRPARRSAGRTARAAGPARRRPRRPPRSQPITVRNRIPNSQALAAGRPRRPPRPRSRPRDFGGGSRLPPLPRRVEDEVVPVERERERHQIRPTTSAIASRHTRASRRMRSSSARSGGSPCPCGASSSAPLPGAPSMPCRTTRMATGRNEAPHAVVLRSARRSGWR